MLRPHKLTAGDGSPELLRASPWWPICWTTTSGDGSPELLRASPDRWIRFPEVAHITGLSKTSVYRYMNERGFPRPKKHLGLRLSLWRLSEVVQWMESLDSQSVQKDV